MRNIDFKGWLLLGYLIVYMLATMLIGSRPPLAFLPYGLGMLVVLAVGIVAAVLAYKVNDRRVAFLKVFTICCIVVAGYTLVQAFLYIRLGENIYWVRSLAGLPLLYLAWLFVMDSKRFVRIFGRKHSVY